MFDDLEGETGLKNILEFRVVATTNRPVMTEEQEEAFNPLAITVGSVRQLPCRPTPFSSLESRCHPTSISFQFFGQNRTVWRTSSRERGRDAEWNKP